MAGSTERGWKSVYFHPWFFVQNMEKIVEEIYLEISNVVFFWQAIINSTILPNMTFTKTSQKFGQWSDARANTVFGLGFPSEAELNKVSKE